MRLQGKVALITGAAHGMGEAEAKMFAKEGAKVVVADMLEAEGQQVVAGIAEVGGEALFVRLDVTREEDWQKAVETTVARFGKLDILVNNAGISGSSGGDLLSTEAWDKVMDVNAKGVFLGLKYAIPAMQKIRRAAPSSTSRRSRASSARTTSIWLTMPPRGPCAS